MSDQFGQQMLPVILRLIFGFFFFLIPGMDRTILAQQVIPKPQVESFENASPGEFKELKTSLGMWTPLTGKTCIDDKHAKSGRQCLQLTGGEETSVSVEIADGVDTSGLLTFWAERWTARKPFSFRIEKQVRGRWYEIYNGDSKVSVGRAFLNFVKIPLADPGIQRLRFICTSPADTGVLIDDMRIAPARPQKIVKANAIPFSLPALVGTESSPLAKFEIITTGSIKPISVTRIQASISGLDLLKSVELRNEGKPDRIALLMPSSPTTASWDLSIELQEGKNVIWLYGQLKDLKEIDGSIGVTVNQISFSNGDEIKLSTVSSKQRLGVAVRQRQDDGVHTFRIPGLATTNQGTLIGVYDVRRRNGGDLPGDIDVGMSRSIDGGRTWQPMRIIMDMGRDPKWRYDGIGDPAVLVDRNTGTIWVAATWSHGNRSWNGSGPGMKPEETGQLMLVRSDDDGVTWSKPINITRQVKNPEWCFILQGPGKGITMRDGTIVFAAQFQDPPSRRRLPHSTIIYSRDHGKTWQIGSGAYDDTTEAQVVEIEPGVLMLNCRYNRKSARVVMTTRDMGKTWQKHATSERALIEPRACMASLINVDQEVGREVGGWLLFSNPDSLSGRNRISIKASPDGGKTWPRQHRLLLDEGNSAGYSCMSMIDEKTIGILYEGSQAHMTFQRIPLNDLTGNAIPRDKERETERGQSQLSMPKVFGDNMVLQADADIPIWGSARPYGKIKIELGDESISTQADQQGRWSVRFPPRNPSSSAVELHVRSDGQRIKFANVLIGEVWLCAGQSNMEWMLKQSANGSRELNSKLSSQIRLLHLEPGARGNAGSYKSSQLARLEPGNYLHGTWEVAKRETAQNFSAVAWYFGRYLQAKLNVPIGLICPAVGGTPTEAWIPRDALESKPDLRGMVVGNWLDNPTLGEFCRERGEQNLLALIQAGEPIPSGVLGPNHPFQPGFMWQAGIQPLIPYALRGVIWYQGESNAENSDRVQQHERLFSLLVEQWRKRWGQGSFPFLFVQLPALERNYWPHFRDSQRRLLGKLNGVGMAVTIDTGHPSNVHPLQKSPVGIRLAVWALGTTYQSNAHSIFSGPLYKSSQIKGNSIVVEFEHAGKTLKSSDGYPLRHFEICGDDGVFYSAKSIIITNHKVSVSSEKVPQPRHVRYMWSGYPRPSVNFFNSADLPASPFTSQSQQKPNIIGQRNLPKPGHAITSMFN